MCMLYVLQGGSGNLELKATKQPGSVYSLAMTPSGSLLAAGTSTAIIRLLDPRACQKVCKLRGHTDTVRCLLLTPDGSKLVSGASDGSIKLWDVGMGRCIQVWCAWPHVPLPFRIIERSKKCPTDSTYLHFCDLT